MILLLIFKFRELFFNFFQWLSVVQFFRIMIVLNSKFLNAYRCEFWKFSIVGEILVKFNEITGL